MIGRIHKNSERLHLKENISLPGFEASLIGSISHIGSSTTSGHYISYVKALDDWYHCDDRNVTVTEFSTFCDSKECNLLFLVLTT